MDLTPYLAAWGATPLEVNPNMPKLFTRTMGGKLFQFQKLDVRVRTSLGMQVMSLIEPLQPMFEAGMAMRDMDDAQRKAAALQLVPQVIARLTGEQYFDLLMSLCNMAMVQMPTGTFERLSVPIAAEHAFDDDLTLQLPVAASVVEVNLGDGFFNRLAGVFS